MKVCKKCSKIIMEGFLFQDTEVYCSIPCLNTSEEDFHEMLERGTLYWSEWKMKDTEGFEFNGVFVENPYLDETGRFRVDPYTYYVGKFADPNQANQEDCRG